MIRIDLEAGCAFRDTPTGEVSFPLGSREAFEIISEVWLHCTWETKYVYSFSWLGRPIIQLPDDLLRLQELVYQLKPDAIVETGVAHGGGQVFFASLCKAMGHGRVIGVDIEIRPHNRKAIESHELFPLITLIEGSSIDPKVVERVKSLIGADKPLFFFDSNHTKAHVLAELEAYSPLVPVGGYMIAADGIMERLSHSPRGKAGWTWNNPKAAVQEFLAAHPEFEACQPTLPFNEGLDAPFVTYWPSGYLRRVR
jgi:cephalosporin hydroxylase